ncbi:MAG: N-acetylmuramoyl-L-alanine amidase [Blastocatellia bacterium]|nr:N-acetylmuramoyl-L-alanine amidase [Blastocatellia bacterium]
MKSRYRFITFFMVIVLLLTLNSSPGFKAQQNNNTISLTKKLIKQADLANEKLHNRPISERIETEYLTIIELYRQALVVDTEKLQGDEALLAMAQISEEAAYYLRKPRYYYNAASYYRQLIDTYIQSPHKARALIRMAKILENPPFDPQLAINAYSDVIKFFPNSVSAREANANISRLIDNLKATGANLQIANIASLESNLERQITGIRAFTGADYSRIVIDLSAPVTYEKALMNSKFLSVQVHEVKVLPQLLDQQLEIEKEGLLKDFQITEFEKKVRIDIKFDKIEDYAIFTLNNPDRLMIDLRGKAKPTLVDTSLSLSDKGLPTLDEKPTQAGLSLMRALGLKVKRIVIDAGHGGHDTGALGPNGLQEKDLVLDVALRLQKLIKQQLPEIDIVMTRNKDEFISLEERTAIANSQTADLFISIHANSGQSLEASGIETYYLSIKASKEELEVAARENASTARNAHDLQALLQKIVLEDKILESKDFAHVVQQSLVTGLRKIDKMAGLDRGVKKAPFIVLVGANMPSVLSEISFVSNPQQAKLLQTEGFRQNIAQALFNGVNNYVDTLKKGNNLTVATK